MTKRRTPSEHPWPALCEQALCSPDFDVVYGLNRTEAITWLNERLARYGHGRSLDDIAAAYDAWPPDEEGTLCGSL